MVHCIVCKPLKSLEIVPRSFSLWMQNCVVISGTYNAPSLSVHPIFALAYILQQHAFIVPTVRQWTSEYRVVCNPWYSIVYIMGVMFV